MGTFGVHGWVRVKPYSSHAEALLGARCWWFEKQGMREFDVRQARKHGEDIIVQLVGIVDRDAAEGLKGTLLHISRRYFPPLDNNESYWIDLLGLSVKNLHGERLGLVTGLMESGAHSILRVAPDEESGTESRQAEILIPFIEKFVPTIDQEEKVITVDWERDYSR